MSDKKKNQEEARYRRFRRDAKDAQDGLSKWQEQSTRDFGFYANDQWDSKDEQALRAEQRAPIVFNQVARVINIVSGHEIANRFEPKYEPRTPDDQGGNDVLNAFVRHSRERNDAEQEDSIAFRDALICGVGCTEVFFDDSENLDGEIVTKRVPIYELGWDPSAGQQNLGDARYVIRGKWISEADFRRMWPEYEGSVVNKDNDYFESNASPTEDASLSWLYLPDSRAAYRHRENEVLVVEHQYRKPEAGIVYTRPDGFKDFAFSDEFEEVRRFHMETSMTDVAANGLEERHRDRYYRCFYVGDEELSYGPSPINDFTYRFITGFEDKKDRITRWFGLLELMRDPQQWSNKFLSQIIHIIATNPKGALISAPGMFDNPKEAQKQWAKPGGFIQAASGDFKERLMHIGPSPAPHAALTMMEYCVNMVPQSAGVNMAYFGGQSEDLRRTAASSVQAVQRQALAPLAPLFDSFKRYRRGLGKVYLDFIRDYVNPQTLVRIAGPTAQQFAELTLDRMFATYDVVVDENPNTLTSQQEAWASLMEQGVGLEMFKAGVLPPEMVVELHPNLTQDQRQKWMDHIQMQKQAMAAQAQQGPPPPPEGVP